MPVCKTDDGGSSPPGTSIPKNPIVSDAVGFCYLIEYQQITGFVFECEMQTNCRPAVKKHPENDLKVEHDDTD